MHHHHHHHLEERSEGGARRVGSVEGDHVVVAGEVDCGSAGLALHCQHHFGEGDRLVEAVEQQERRVLEVPENDGHGPLVPERKDPGFVRRLRRG